MRDAKPAEIHAPSTTSTTAPTDTEGSPRTIEPNASPDSSEITDPSQAPYRAHGKVFFTSSNGYDYVCSGTVVSSPAGNTVVTAGHCTHEPDGFVHNWAFVPAYKNGNDPFGTWVGRELFTTQGWKTSEDFRYDLGFITVDDLGGKSIEETVGARGIAFNQDPFQEVDAIGYPAGAPFTGKKMIVCEKTVAYRNGNGAMAPLGIDCEMTGGSSGGGWVIQDQYVNSVVSYSIVGEDDILYGPYFGQVAEALYEEVAGSSAPGPDPGPDPDPDPDPTEPPDGHVSHDMTLTLKLVGHLRATGTLWARDGSRACAEGAVVEIYRLNRQGTGIYIGETKTDANGRFSLTIRNRRGRYLAFAPGRSSGNDVCGEGVSRWSRRS